MRFCNICNNMFYAGSEPGETPGEPPRLVFSCKHCSNKEYASQDSLRSPVVVCDREAVSAAARYMPYMTPDIQHDVSLPRVDNIKCPNTDCCRPAGAREDVIYAKYDNLHMLFVYRCMHCGHFWRNERA